MPSAYNSQQRLAIQQFTNVASTDQKTAIKVSAQVVAWVSSQRANLFVSTSRLQDGILQLL